MSKQRFNSFSELARHKKEGEHYSIVTRETTTSNIIIVAPHGGNIEPKTDEIAKKIAANDYSLYSFEGLGPGSAYFELHVESHRFDEPRCLDMIGKTDITLTIHGCQEKEPVIYLGGKDEKLKRTLAEEFNKHGIKAVTKGHPYTGTHPQNICNRNRPGQGVQLEFSRGLRDDPALVDQCVDILRKQLKDMPR